MRNLPPLSAGLFERAGVEAPIIVSIEDQIREIEREQAKRNDVYPGLVDKGRLRPEVVARRKLVLEAVRQTLLRVQRAGGTGS